MYMYIVYIRRYWSFPVDDFEGWLASEPQYVLSQMLAARAEGSLLSLLKKEGLATSVDVGIDEQVAIAQRRRGCSDLVFVSMG